MDKFHEYISERGNLSRLASALGVTPGAVAQWKKRIPAERVIATEAATGIPRHELRPDIYPQGATQ